MYRRTLSFRACDAAQLGPTAGGVTEIAGTNLPMAANV